MKDETKSLCFFCGVVAESDIRFNKIFRPWFLEKRIEHPEKAEVYLVGSCGSASWDDFDRFFQVDVAFKVTDRGVLDIDGRFLPNLDKLLRHPRLSDGNG